MVNNTNICVDHVITKLLVQHVIISATATENEKARCLARITVIARSVSVTVMVLARNANVTRKVHEVVLTIVTVKMMLKGIAMGKDIVGVTVKDRVTVGGHATVKDSVKVKDRVTVIGRVIVVVNVTKSVGVTETAKDPGVKRDTVIVIKEERIMS